MIDPTDYFQCEFEDTDLTTCEINRLLDENVRLKELVRDLIQGARRDRSIITPRLGPLHVIETRVTKGQIMQAIQMLSAPTPHAPRKRER